MPEGKSTSYCIVACLFFSAIMLIGGFMYSEFNPNNITLSHKVWNTLILILMPFFLNVLVELIYFVFPKMNTRKANNSSDPFWYRIIEGTFSVWIVIVIIMVIAL